MGNNKGRSKACITCLRRRVKCDEQRPACARCLRSGLTCLGYRETLFIDGQVQVLRRLGRKPLSSSENKTPGHKKDLLAPRHVVSEDRLCDDEASIIWSIPSDVALRYYHFTTYLVTRLNGPMEIICRTQLAPGYQADSPGKIARKQCFLALATSFYGLAHIQQPLVHYGRQLYLQALNMVKRTVSDCSSTHISETISSVFALCLHEAIAPTLSIEHSWLRHVDGLEQLFAMHGVTASRSNPLIVALLDITRPMMIVAALYARRPSLMAQPAWRATSICVQDECSLLSPETIFAYLLDLLAQIPALYHDHDNIASQQSARSVVRTTSPSGVLGQDSLISTQALLRHTLSLRGDLYSQKARWAAFNHGLEPINVSDTIVPLAYEYPYNDWLSFSSPPALKVFTFYNAVVILLSQLIVSLQSLPPTSNGHSVAQVAASEQISVAVTQIVKSSGTHLLCRLPSDPANGSAETPVVVDTSDTRSFYLLFPIRVAHRVLSESQVQSDIAKRLWLEMVLSTTKDNNGTWMSNDQIFGPGKSSNH